MVLFIDLEKPGEKQVWGKGFFYGPCIRIRIYYVMIIISKKSQ